MSCEGPYLVERFLQNFCPCFHNVLAQLGFIARTGNKFVEITAVLERYLFINSGIKEKAHARNQDIFRAGVESNKLGHRFLSLLNKNNIFHSENIVGLNSILRCCLINMSTTQSTLTAVICCIWSRFESLSRRSFIVLQMAVFSLPIPDAALSASVDLMGDTAPISNNLRIFEKTLNQQSPTFQWCYLVNHVDVWLIFPKVVPSF